MTHITLNETQRREIERRLNDQAEERFTSEDEMATLFDKYRRDRR